MPTWRNPRATHRIAIHTLERDKISLADSDTTMRPMRQPSALENPSPATTVPPSSHPFVLLFRHSPDTKLPRMRQGFPSWFRYNNETMRQPSALENPSPATTVPPSSHPFVLLFRHSPDTKLPRMRQGFPSWFRYNNETMRQISATKTSPQLRSLSRQLRTCPLAPCFHSYEKPPNGTRLP